MFDRLDLTPYSDMYAWEADFDTKTAIITALPAGPKKSCGIDVIAQHISGNDIEGFKQQFALAENEERRCVDALIRLDAGKEQRSYNVKGTVLRTADGKKFASGFAYDVESTAERLESMQYLKSQDSLTGLASVEALEGLGEAALCLCPYSMVLACIDNLREINDSLGFFAGNELIKNVAEVIKECFSDSDITVRLGGGEFCALFSGKDALEIEMKIKEATMMIHKAYLNLIKTEVSFGYAITNDSADILSMYRQASSRMKRNRNIRKILSSESIIDRINDIISAKAGWGKRSSRLQSLSAQIAAELGCTGDQINEIKALAKIADLGYVGVSDDLIINRNNFSDSDEGYFKHVEEGCSLMAQIFELSDMENLYADIFKRYDEWQEGISLPSRIVAGAIGFDDISLSCGTVRIKNIIGYMESEKGLRYCPKVVDAIVKITNKHLLVQYRAI